MKVRFLSSDSHTLDGRSRHGPNMVSPWLKEAMSAYNQDSQAKVDEYVAQVHLPGKILESILSWAFEALPDEILVGLEVDSKQHHLPEVDARFSGNKSQNNLFAGQGLVISEAVLMNRGNSYSVHHLPEEWTDEIFGVERGPRAGRFTHWLHTHPNCVAIPSEADADAAQSTDGVDMILGIEFTPEGFNPWFDDVEGERRKLSREKRTILGIAPTGHHIHSLELIGFHKRGMAINVVLIDDDGQAY